MAPSKPTPNPDPNPNPNPNPQQVPLHYCVFTLFCIVGGAMVYNEFEHLTTQGWITFSCGGACCLLGVVVLTTPHRLVCSAAPISCHLEKQACACACACASCCIMCMGMCMCMRIVCMCMRMRPFREAGRRF